MLATDTSTIDTATLASARVKFLVEPTSTAWIELALSTLDEILLNQSHCERKAASAALNLMVRYPSSPKLVKVLTAIPQKEQEHFKPNRQSPQPQSLGLLAEHIPAP